VATFTTGCYAGGNEETRPLPRLALSAVYIVLPPARGCAALSSFFPAAAAFFFLTRYSMLKMMYAVRLFFGAFLA